jgi:Base plate wedge protein 53
MAEKYFEKFPIIAYNGAPVRNITERTVVLNSVYNNPIFYYPYDIQQNEQPDEIADRYYEDEYMGWILHITNKVIDPYYDWYLDQTTFDDFIIKKYGSLQNATSKIKYYRNNWYANEGTISVSAFDSLTPTVKRFYEPIYADVVFSTTPLAYKRKQIDWKLTTNAIVQYTVTQPVFVTDEIVDVYSGNTIIGSGQVCGRSISYITSNGQTTISPLLIQHTSGNVTENGATHYVMGRETKVKTLYTNATLITNNIPTNESTYWSPVYYYDYETEINEKNKSIQVLKKQYSSQIAGELKSMLK